jgi:hypothetical protein
MKRMSVALLVLAAVGSFSLSAAAAPNHVTKLLGLLTLRPGVSRTGHPAVTEGVYGEFVASYNDGSSKLTYTLRYKGLAGTPFRVVVRSRATGADFAVLCSPCSAVSAGTSARDSLPASKIAGQVQIDPDTAFLISSGRAFVEVDTTAYPAGEIGGRIFLRPQSGGITDVPRCC